LFTPQNSSFFGSYCFAAFLCPKIYDMKLMIADADDNTALAADGKENQKSRRH